jgi:hypothetical protein
MSAEGPSIGVTAEMLAAAVAGRTRQAKRTPRMRTRRT